VTAGTCSSRSWLRGTNISNLGTAHRENNLKHSVHALAFAALMATVVDAGATVITFDNLAVGTTLSTQYAGVVFTPNALVGGTFADNTDMAIVSATGSDVGFDLGTPSLVSGNVLRSFNGYLSEDGDPSFRISFAAPITSFSATFAGVFDASDVTLFGYNGTTLVRTVVGTSADAQFTLALAGALFTSVIVTPGTFNDYVVVDNVQFAPEPETWLLIAFGLGVVAWSRRWMQQRARVGAHFVVGSSGLAMG
jgi:hypothetical protein